MMRKVIKMFFNIRKEQEWLAEQVGWRLVKTNGIRYIFEESENRYAYEYVYFEKSKKELDGIIAQITDKSIEVVCSTSSWVLFRKDQREGDMQVFAIPYDKYRMLMVKYNSCLALGACYMGLGASQVALASSLNGLFGVSGALLFFCSSLFFINASILKKYAAEYDDGTFAAVFKMDKR